MNAPVRADQLHAPAAAVAQTRMRAHAVVKSEVSVAPAGLSPLASISVPAWDDLAARAIEPNACYLPLWALAVANHARGRADAFALAADDTSAPGRLTGLMPVRWASRALSLPVPLLVSWNAYAPFSVPLLDRDCAVESAGALVEAAVASGARALLLQTTGTGGPAFAALSTALAQRGLTAEILRGFRRAGLDATRDAETALRDALSTKKLRELRRQRNRLEDKGAVSFDIASTPDRIGPALEAFLTLEAAGWKGARGTALIQDAGDAAFIREAAPALAARGQFEIASLTRNGDTLAAGLILRDSGRAFFFKVAMDETEAKTSPGVQLTLDLTKHLCADPHIAFADSAADGEHPMIDHVWRERIDIADVFVALKPRDPRAFAIRALIQARYHAIDIVRTLRRIREKHT
jgi:CelD/BcsL family acetyltransferase involved in cellulose biosynthesis